MKIKKILSGGRVPRFILIGLANAAISLGILNLAYYQLGAGKLLASIIATTCALIFSFYMNRNFVFNDKSHKIRHQAVPFIIVTITGSLLILNFVYWVTLHLITGREALIIDIIRSITTVTLRESFVDINVSTVVGAMVAMFWNYNGYRLFVFTGKYGDEEQNGN